LPAWHRCSSAIHGNTLGAGLVRHRLAFPHTASVQLVHALTVSSGQIAHAAHAPAAPPLHPLARYRPAVQAAHARHAVAPLASWYDPALHRRHVDTALLGL
jgi:hypothetical protein